LTIQKTASVAFANPGDLITFRIEISHAPSSNAHAFDVVVTDVIPAGLLNVTNLQWDTSSSQPPDDLNYDGTTITARWNQFLDDDTTSVITFEAQMGAVAPGQTVVNTASVEWSSLLGDFTAPISTHNPNSTERWYDPDDDTGLNTYGGVTDSATVRPPSGGRGVAGERFELPGTGFTPGRITRLPRQPKAKKHQALGAVWLEIPSINVRTSIVGIPLAKGGWDVSWLWDQAGYLEGTAYPTTEGNTVITSHVYLPNGLPGPFANLTRLRTGDEIIIHASGQQYVYQIRSRHIISPHSLSIFEHKDADWVTLMTCSSYNETTKTYRYRFFVQAILVNVGPDF
jgi:LPXTG-site transpeptidase (sortase) family protein